MRMKTWRIAVNGRVLEAIHKEYKIAVFAAQVLRGMGHRKVKVVRA